MFPMCWGSVSAFSVRKRKRGRKEEKGEDKYIERLNGRLVDWFRDRFSLNSFRMPVNSGASKFLLLPFKVAGTNRVSFEVKLCKQSYSESIWGGRSLVFSCSNQPLFLHIEGGSSFLNYGLSLFDFILVLFLFFDAEDWAQVLIHDIDTHLAIKPLHLSKFPGFHLEICEFVTSICLYFAFAYLGL